MKQFYTFLAAVLLTATTLAQVGINTDSPDPFAALDIVSTTGGLLVPRMTKAERDGITSPSQGLIIFCKDCASGEGELQVKLTSSWKNTIGGDVNNPPPPPVVGDIYGGGIVFYLLGPSDTGYVEGETHGLIAAEQNQIDASPGIQWIIGGDTQTTSNGGTSALIEKGQANTAAMMSQTNYTGGAATVCDDYSTTVNGITYNDWFLPSIDELIEMYQNIGQGDALGLGNAGNFASTLYWSSTENSNDTAWVQSFDTGIDFPATKEYTRAVRAVRAF